MNKFKQSSVVLATVLVSTVLPLGAASVDLSKLPPPAKQDGVTYSKDIRPLFEASCFRCHGVERPKAGLRLDSLAGVLKGSKEGKVVVPGQSEKSQLVISVSRLDDETAMPPKPKQGRRGGQKGPPRGTQNGSGDSRPNASNTAGTNQPPARRPMGPPPKPLTAEQVGLIRAWVDQGAK